MLVTVLILAPIAALLGALSLAARRDRRAGRVLEPRRIATIEPAVVIVLPDPGERDDRGAFAYDNGLITEDS
jgi:hypothetical protein